VIFSLDGRFGFVSGVVSGGGSAEKLVSKMLTKRTAVP
jgi:hypothetical protein